MRHEAGFTLAELMATLAIMTVVAAISIPTVTNIVELGRLKAAARFIKGDMMNQRMICVKERHDIVFYFNSQVVSAGGVSYFSNSGSYVVWSDKNRDGIQDAGEVSQRVVGSGMVGGEVVDRFPGVTLASSVNTVTFDSRGGANEGIITMTDSQGRQRKVVVSVAGMVKVE